MCKFWLALTLVLLTAYPVHAIELSISNIPQSADEDCVIPISFNLSQGTSASSTVYLRSVFYKEGTTKYFGYTQNHKGEWVNDTADKSQFFELTASSEGSASGIISAKLDKASSYYDGAGVYKIKLGRYTSSGDSSADWSNELEVVITTKSTPTPSPSPTPFPSPTATPTPTPKPSPLPSPTPKPSPTPSISTLTTPKVGTVAGETTEIDLSGFGVLASPIASPKQLAEAGSLSLNHSRAKTATVVGSGLLMLSLAGYFGYRKYHSVYNQET